MASNDVADVLVAYEPIWAIGEHGRPAHAEDVEPVFAALHEEHGQRLGGFLYGGSVNLDNATELLAIPGNSGLFIGRAAWDVANYIRILDTAAGLS